LVTSTMSEVSNVVGSFSWDTSSSITACLVLYDGLPLQASSSPQSCITFSLSVFGAVELGKRLRSSSTVLSNS
jgi:hypothetical protein